jgi:glutamate racemase
MHILITDSGVGGLSVVAYAERFVRERGFTEPVRLTFANAAPANDFGYNAMRTREEKLETFDRFLRNVTARYTPDSIYVACNTLSVLLPDTPYMRDPAVPVQGIVETGVHLLLRGLQADPRSVAMIFGTQTTIDAGTYPRLLQERGMASSRIVSQACPGLADTISAVAKMPDRDAPIVACLACTHYGYRKDVFEAALPGAVVLNPNERAVEDLFPSDGPVHDVDVQFVTRYAIPRVTVEALTWFLDEISPRTVQAMQNFVHVPELF